MSGLSTHNPLWDQARAGDPGRVYEDDAVLIATDFEGGNGTNIRRLDDGGYALTLEDEPGNHRFSGKPYYVCFGVRNKEAASREIDIRLEAKGWGNWGEQTQHLVLRQGGAWRQLDRERIQTVADLPDAVQVNLPLPGAEAPNPVLFVSNFHWWPYTERVAHVRGLDGARVHEIGRSAQGRPLYAVEIGREDDDAPCMIHAQTQQPSEMGHLACRGMIDWLLSDDPEAGEIRAGHRICFLPMTNPDGTVLGYALSDGQGRLPCFEAHLAARGDPEATPATAALWRYVQERRPWLFWSWHSNNWARRPGHMVYAYRPYLIGDPQRRALYLEIREGLLALPDTHHAMWLSPTEGHDYGRRITHPALVQFSAVANTIKQHDKYPLAQSWAHAVASLKLAAQAYDQAGR